MADQNLRNSARRSEYDEHDAFLCACKGEPYTLEEWEAETTRLAHELSEARMAVLIAREHSVCMPARWPGRLKDWRERRVA